MLLPRSAKQALFVAIAAFLYYWAIYFGVHLVTAARPGWWGAGLSSVSSVYSWLHLTQGAALFLLSVPFAFAILLFWPSHPVRVALVVAVLGAIAPAVFLELSSLRLLEALSHSKLSAAVDFLKFIGTLPLVTWLASRVMPSNNSFKPNPLRGSA